MDFIRLHQELTQDFYYYHYYNYYLRSSEYGLLDEHDRYRITILIFIYYFVYKEEKTFLNLVLLMDMVTINLLEVRVEIDRR